MKRNSNQYDVIVIGAGSGGLNIAGFMNRINLKVLLIDKSDKNIGGDCLNFGCVPSKALIHVAREIYAGKKSEKFGRNISGNIDIKKVMDYVREKQEIIRVHENAEHFRKIGMTVELGMAKFTGKDSVSVDSKEFFAKKIIIATGSRPRTFELEGLDKVPVYTNETIFDIETLPNNLVFVGGGPISLELGQAFTMLGSNVTIVHGGTKLLEKEDLEVGVFMKNELESMGIKIILNSRPKKFENGELVVTTPTGEMRVPTDAIFAGIGRVLNIENLDLENAGVDLSEDKSKIFVDKYLRTTNKNILTVGDIAGGLMFTHAAELHAGVIISNFFSPLKKKLNTDSFGWVTYTSPEIATFGLGKVELEKRKIDFQEIESSLDEDDRAIVDSSRGFLKVFVGKKGKVLGGTLVAPQAGEIVGELILAQTKGLTLADLFNRVAPYPTAARIIKRVASKYQANKLTEKAKKILRFLWGCKI